MQVSENAVRQVIIEKKPSAVPLPLMAVQFMLMEVRGVLVSVLVLLYILRLIYGLMIMAALLKY